MDAFGSVSAMAKPRHVMTEAEKAKAFDAVAALLDVVPEMVVEAVESREDYVDHIEAINIDLNTQLEAVTTSMETMVVALVGDVADEKARNGQTAAQFKAILMAKLKRRLGDDPDGADSDDG